MKLIQLLIFFQFILLGVVIAADNSTQVDSGKNGKDVDSGKSSDSNKTDSDNNKPSQNSTNTDTKLDKNDNQNNSTEKNKDKKDDEDEKINPKDKLSVSIELLKPTRMQAVEGIMFAIGESVEFEWKWGKDVKPKKNPKGFNLLAVRQVGGNIARYPIATNISSSTFKYYLDATSENNTNLIASFSEASDYLLYIYDSANGDNYLGTNGAFNPFVVKMKLYRSRTPSGFVFSNANRNVIPFAISMLLFLASFCFIV